MLPAPMQQHDIGSDGESPKRSSPSDHAYASPSTRYIVVAQGRKELHFGTDTLMYDSSHYLLTSVDLPTVTRVPEASEAAPCLPLSLKLDISIVREFLSREEFYGFDAPIYSPATSTGPVTVEFLGAWCRLLTCSRVPRIYRLRADLSNPRSCIEFCEGRRARGYRQSRRWETRVTARLWR